MSSRQIGCEYNPFSRSQRRSGALVAAASSAVESIECRTGLGGGRWRPIRGVAVAYCIEPLESRCLLSAAGDLDLTFGSGGKLTMGLLDSAGAQAIVVQPWNQKILSGGFAHSAQTSQDYPALARYNPDGSLDSTFGTGGVVDFTSVPGDVIDSLTLQPDHKIVAGGFSSATQQFVLERYNEDGTLDTSFGTNGIARFYLPPLHKSYGYDVAIQPDGKIIMVGDSNGKSNEPTSSIAIARVDTSGNLDGTFGQGGMVITKIAGNYGGSGFARSVALEGNGDIVVVAQVSLATSSDLVDCGVLRYDTFGNLLNTSVDNFGSNFAIPTDVVISPSGQLYVQSMVHNQATGYDLGLARYNPDGILDLTFGGGTGWVHTDFGGTEVPGKLAVGVDGKIISFGYTQDVNGDQARFAMVRYNPDGTPDAGFGVNGQVTTTFAAGRSYGSDVAIQADGGILVCGNVVLSSGSEVFALARYLGDGSVVRGATLLVVPNGQVTGTYGGTITLTATLTSNGAALANAQVLFTLNGSSVGSAITNASGVAALNGVNLGGINAGTYNNAIIAHYAGDASHLPADAIPASLVINKADATVTVNGYTRTYDAAAHGATGTAVGVDAGGAAVGSSLALGLSFTNAPGGTATWTFAGGTNYNDQSGTTAILILKAVLPVAVTSNLMLANNAPPALTGVVNGVAFTGSNSFTSAFGDMLTVTLTSAVSANSPVGTYGVVATVTGAQSANYMQPSSGNIYVVTVGQDSGTGARNVSFWDNKGNAKMITIADLAALDLLDLRNANGSNFDPTTAAQLEAWLRADNGRSIKSLSIQVATMDLNLLSGYVNTTDVVFAGLLQQFVGTIYSVTGLDGGGFITVGNLMAIANNALAQYTTTHGSIGLANYLGSLQDVLAAANNNSSFVQQLVPAGI